MLLWLNMAVRQEPLAKILADHWATYGRDYYVRHDYEGLDADAAQDVIASLRAELPNLPGRRLGSLTVEAADEFTYTDPVDGSVATHQGIRVVFAEGARLVYRLSGTGTSGATLRVYLERYGRSRAGRRRTRTLALSELAGLARDLAQLPAKTGRTTPRDRLRIRA